MSGVQTFMKEENSKKTTNISSTFFFQKSYGDRKIKLIQDSSSPNFI